MNVTLELNRDALRRRNFYTISFDIDQGEWDDFLLHNFDIDQRELELFLSDGGPKRRVAEVLSMLTRFYKWKQANSPVSPVKVQDLSNQPPLSLPS